MASTHPPIPDRSACDRGVWARQAPDAVLLDAPGEPRPEPRHAPAGGHGGHIAGVWAPPAHPAQLLEAEPPQAERPAA
jgi:hypothetical protein